jgi:hypothetical protein
VYDDLKVTNPGKADEVMEGLYRALYFIIQYPDVLYNKPLNRGMGSALAVGVQNPASDPDITSLRNILQQAMNKAIEEV